MKQWAALITAIAGLLLAAASFVQAMREPKARAAYEEHAKNIEATQGAVAENHKDLERLSTYVATQPPPPQVIIYDPPPASGAHGAGGMGGSGGSPTPKAAASAAPPMPKPLKIPAPPRAFDSL